MNINPRPYAVMLLHWEQYIRKNNWWERANRIYMFTSFQDVGKYYTSIYFYMITTHTHNIVPPAPLMVIARYRGLLAGPN